MNCERCGTEADRLYSMKITEEDEYGDEKQVEKKVCWSCDWDISNGGDIHADAGDILQDRAENEYAYDPINNPRPW